MLVDPDYGVPFYVGKGMACATTTTSPKRSLSWPKRSAPSRSRPRMSPASGEDKRDPGQGFRLWAGGRIVRYGLQKAEYTAAEAALMSLRW